jgi:glyoxylase-like metal-dependent hydrolase (beta-lactamase superfamily II)
MAVMAVACSTPGESPWRTPDGIDIPAAPMRDWDMFDRADAGVEIIRGSFAPGRQPDGNSVLLTVESGLIVFDTGRHSAHTQQIIDVAKTAGQPVVAIINSHWHLDHISGNSLLLAHWPAAEVYASPASLSEALVGFLARGLDANRKMLSDPATPASLAEDLRGDIATVERSERLYPSIAIEASRTLMIGGRRLEVYVAKAATSGDIWIHDPAASLVVAGDLVTLPAPFLDTACPEAWRGELELFLRHPSTGSFRVTDAR